MLAFEPLDTAVSNTQWDANTLHNISVVMKSIDSEVPEALNGQRPQRHRS